MFQTLFKRQIFSSVSLHVNGIRSLSSFQFSSQLTNEIQFTFSALKQSNSVNSELLVIPFTQSSEITSEAKINHLTNSIPSGLSEEIRKIIQDVITEESFVASESDKFIIRLQNQEKCKYLALVGLGNSKIDGISFGRSLVSVARQIKSKTVATFFPAGPCPTQIYSGIYEGSYEEKRYKSKSPTKPTNEWPGIKTITVFNDSTSELTTLARNSSMIAKGVVAARELVGAPPNIKTPLVLSNFANDIAKNFPSFTCKVLGQTECESLGMGGYLAVQQGSKFPPQFIHLTYTSPTNGASADKVKKVALIGKGLTFDSGGYNLKVGASSSIEMMKYDMGGSAAVLGCARAIAELQPENLEIHFIVAACENMISANAMRPGDIVTASNGKTIEILNTDAEGRLTLADALVYADTLKPDWIIDLATLTGACVVALGEESAGVYSDNTQLLTLLHSAAEKTGDDLWHMPLNKKYKKNIKSTIADIKNIGDRGGGSITAALFLQEFVTRDNWAHIDMAGPVWDGRGHNPTGYGVKLLTEFLLNVNK